MTEIRLGRLTSEDPGKVWKKEAIDFTPWLAGAENLELLGDTIGLELELQSIETNVGAFRADIVCKDTANDSFVLIENQLARTDHSHLGQILTYAAGLDAVTIIWIAVGFTDEHRAAIDWLNKVTNESINFFGLELELWKIGNSDRAPKFNIVCKPNNWIKVGAKRRAGNGALTPTQLMQFDFWAQFQKYVGENSKIIKPRAPQAVNWMPFAIGSSDFNLLGEIGPEDRPEVRVSLGLYGPFNKKNFDTILADKAEVEATLGPQVNWYRLDHKKSAYITTVHPGLTYTERSQWPAINEWMLGMLEKYHSFFANRVKELNKGSKSPSIEAEQEVQA